MSATGTSFELPTKWYPPDSNAFAHCARFQRLRQAVHAIAVDSSLLTELLQARSMTGTAHTRRPTCFVDFIIRSPRRCPLETLQRSSAPLLEYLKIAAASCSDYHHTPEHPSSPAMVDISEQRAAMRSDDPDSIRQEIVSRYLSSDISTDLSEHALRACRLRILRFHSWCMRSLSMHFDTCLLAH